MITVLVLDKIMQGWQSNRYGCTLSKIGEFKHLEEKIRLINEGVRNLEPTNKTSEVKKVVKHDSEYLTVMEAKRQCLYIQSLYREQTREVKENRIKEELIYSLKRKYTTDFRYAIKFLAEQLSM